MIQLVIYGMSTYTLLFIKFYVLYTIYTYK